MKELILRLNISLELNLSNVVVADSSLVINALRTKRMKNWKLRAMIENSLKLLERFKNFMLNHTLREGNKEVDVVSNMGFDGISIK